MEISEEYVTAIHEAGHAVMYVLQNKELNRVTIITDRNGLGHCFPSYKNDISSKDDLTSVCLILLSGGIAEKIILNKLPDDLAMSGYSDLKAFEELVSNYLHNANDEDVYFYSILNDIESYFIKPLVQQQIKAVADALMEQKTLSGEQVKQIMKKVKDAATLQLSQD